jgi:hypothetical protein
MRDRRARRHGRHLKREERPTRPIQRTRARPADAGSKRRATSIPRPSPPNPDSETARADARALGLTQASRLTKPGAVTRPRGVRTPAGSGGSVTPASSLSERLPLGPGLSGWSVCPSVGRGLDLVLAARAASRRLLLGSAARSERKLWSCSRAMARRSSFRGSGSLVLLAGASVRSSGSGDLGRLVLGAVGQVHDAVVVGLGGDERELEVKPVVEQAGSVTQRQRVHEEV